MRQKCLLAGDLEAAGKIMQEEDPIKQKSIGKTVKNFNKGEWERQAESLVKEGIKAKVNQNSYIKELLLSTGTRKIAEANKFDRLFAIGYHLKDQQAWDTNNRKRGKNIMGHIFEEIRSELSQ